MGACVRSGPGISGSLLVTVGWVSTDEINFSRLTVRQTMSQAQIASSRMFLLTVPAGP